MDANITLISDNVQATLNYSLPDPAGETLYTYAVRPPPLKNWSNLTLDPRNVTIYNVRGWEDQFSLDVYGFEFMKHSSTQKEFGDEEMIKTRYYAEIEHLVKEYMGGKEVIIIGHTVRRAHDATQVNCLQAAGPSHMIHVDRTPEAAFDQAREALGDDTERLFARRVRLVNIWRPIGSAVQHEPLAMADWQTVSMEEDLIPLRVILPAKEIHVLVARYSKNHRWYYLREQTPSEITFIKCYDSLTDGCSRLSPHSAFHDPRSPPGVSERQSIEVSVLVFG